MILSFQVMVLSRVPLSFSNTALIWGNPIASLSLEYIYVATSPQFPGMVKIGRTDRTPDERMGELSSDDYGTPGYTGDSTWQADHVIKVEDNVAAERVLHEHFSDVRVTEKRELFFSDDPQDIAIESTELVGGELINDAADVLDVMDVFDAVAQYGLILGLGFLGGRVVHEQLKDNEQYKDHVAKADRWATQQKETLRAAWDERDSKVQKAKSTLKSFQEKMTKNLENSESFQQGKAAASTWTKIQKGKVDNFFGERDFFR